jgi:hypothetical protein
VTSRINGLDVVQTLKVLEESYKKYRDGIVHAWIIHPQEAAPSARQQGALYEVLVTVHALNTLYDHLAVLQNEMIAVSGIIFVKTRLVQQELYHLPIPCYDQPNQNFTDMSRYSRLISAGDKLFRRFQNFLRNPKILQ